MISIEDVVYRYSGGDDPALDHVSLTIQEGEFVVLVGPNGSGKSTLARHMNALLVPTEGRITVDGMDTREPAHLWEVRQRVGMVFQNPDNQLVAGVVEEDVAFGPENLGIPATEIRQRIEEALRAVGMQEHRKRAPHLLSGGQKQRVAIAGILAMNPTYLVLDEATAMLDPAGRREVLETITRLNSRDGLTVMHITHFMAEAIWAHRVLVMDRGRVVLTGPPRTVFQQATKLKELGLETPPMTELACLLRAQGVDVPEGIMTIGEMVNALCP